MAFNFCFVCLSDLGRLNSGTEGGNKIGSNSVKFLLNYLLHTETGRFAGLLNQLLGLSGTNGGGGGDGIRLLRMCDKCEGMAGKVLELQLELEKVEMQIVHEVRRVRGRILKGTGWLGGVGVGGREEEMEALANFSERFCGGKTSPKVRQLFRILKGFQSAVYKTEKDSIQVPLVHLEKCQIVPNPDSTVEIEEIPDLLGTVKFELSEEDQRILQEDGLLDDLFLDADDVGGDSDSNWTPNFNEDDTHSNSDHNLVDPENASRRGRTSAAIARSRISQLQDEQEEVRSRPTPKWKKLVKNATTAVRPKPSTSTSGSGSGEEKKIGLTRKKVLLANGKLSADLQFCCESCDYSHANIYRFETHLRSHEVEEEKPFQCSECNQGFSTQQHYRFHQGRHFSMHKLKCDVCKLFLPAFDLPEHLKMREGLEELFPCPNCSHISSSVGKRCEHNLQNHAVGLETEPKCEICGETFFGKWALMDHLEKTHQVITMLKCDVEGCGKTYTRSDRLLQHFRRVHGKYFSCKECKKTFGVKKNLEAHQQTHTAEEKLLSCKCKVCGEVIQSKEVMRRHMIKEHGAPKYDCKICGKEYMDWDGLKFHRDRTHNNGTGVDCPHCDKKFVNEYKLKFHMDLSHGIGSERNFICEICGKGFRTGYLCKKHKMTHGERTYQCKECPKAFYKKEALKLHMMTHTGEKPYTCEFCGIRK